MGNVDFILGDLWTWTLNMKFSQCTHTDFTHEHEKNTLWWTNKKQLKMAIEIVDFPIKNGDFPLLC